MTYYEENLPKIMEILYCPKDLERGGYDEIIDLLDAYLANTALFFSNMGMGRQMGMEGPPNEEFYGKRAQDLMDQIEWDRLSVRKILVVLTSTHILGFPNSEVQKKVVSRVKKTDPDELYGLLHGLIEAQYLE